MPNTQQAILHFWFDAVEPAQWFQKSNDFDRIVRDRFYTDFEMAMNGQLDQWMDDAHGMLAFILLLDQFPRNMFRDDPRAFSGDAKGLFAAKHAVNQGYDQSLPPNQRRFIYLPFEHSEAMEDQNLSVALFEAMKDVDLMGYDYAVRHRDVIEQFGRFPHRNAILGRKNTAAELRYLTQDGAGF